MDSVSERVLRRRDYDPADSGLATATWAAAMPGSVRIDELPAPLAAKAQKLWGQYSLSGHGQSESAHARLLSEAFIDGRAWWARNKLSHKPESEDGLTQKVDQTVPAPTAYSCPFATGGLTPPTNTSTPCLRK